MIVQRVFAIFFIKFSNIEPIFIKRMNFLSKNNNFKDNYNHISCTFSLCLKACEMCALFIKRVNRTALFYNFIHFIFLVVKSTKTLEYSSDKILPSFLCDIFIPKFKLVICVTSWWLSLLCEASLPKSPFYSPPWSRMTRPYHTTERRKGVFEPTLVWLHTSNHLVRA